MSQQCSMVIKKKWVQLVCAIRYKVCRIENVRDDGPILLCLDRSTPGNHIQRESAAEPETPGRLQSLAPKRRKYYD